MRDSALLRMQVSGLAKTSANRLIGTASDGENTMPCNFSTRFVAMYDEKKLKSNDIVQAVNYQATKMNGESKLSLLDLSVVGNDAGSNLSIPEAALTPKRLKTDMVDFG